MTTDRLDPIRADLERTRLDVVEFERTVASRLDTDAVAVRYLRNGAWLVGEVVRLRERVEELEGKR